MFLLFFHSTFYRSEQERKRKSEHETTNIRAPSVDTSLGKGSSLAAIQNMFRTGGEENKRRSSSQGTKN